MIRAASAITILAASAGLLSGTVEAVTYAPQRQHRKPFDLKKIALDVPRGGAAVGPITPATAAKVFGGLLAVNGVAITVAPAKFCESYGIDTAEVSGSSLKIWRRNGIAILASGILAVCLLFRDDSLNLAMGLASLPMAISAALSLLNNDSETIGPSKAGDLSILAVHGAASLAGLTDASWANVAYKVLAGYALVAGIPLILQPSLATDLWQLKEEVDDASSRAIGVNYATLGLLVGALALGIETTKAFGCSLLLIWPFIVYVNHINDDLANLGVNKGAMAFYTALYLAIAGITLID